MKKVTPKTSKLQQALASQKAGFTMIEFSIATAFIAVLLISIAIITSNIITTYQKGLSLKAVNSVGRGLIDEFTETINAAPAVDTTSLCNSHVSDEAQQKACKDNRANNFIFQQRTDRRTPPGEVSHDVQMGGIFCTGKYSYIWNTYYAHEAQKDGRNAMLTLSYSYLDESGNRQNGKLEDFRMARIEDPTYRVCSAMVKPDYSTIWSGNSSQLDIDITKLSNGTWNYIKEPEQGFLNSFDLDLWLYELSMFPISQDDFTLRTFMSGSFILATERGNINISRSSDYCDIENLKNEETASDILNIGSEFNYCAINKFNFAARTAGM